MASGWILHTLYAGLLASLGQDNNNNNANILSSRDTKANDVFVTNIAYGKVRGMNVTSKYGDVIQFLGIPYAKPPTGSLRFQRPFPPDPWTGDKDAFSFGSVCIQTANFTTSAKGNEDCLYLNVYIPANADISNEPLSVMVWVHGGGYFIGEGSSYDGSGLASRGVIVVTFNYRLDALGFLSTEDDVMPGNYGMMDQIFALKWVQQNIAAFGGDPKKVTIFGESAGSSSVSLLLLSPLAKGLFRGAIMESGSSLCPWAITHPATSVSPKLVSHFVGATVGCTQRNSTALLDCLRKIDQSTLLKASISIQGVIRSNNMVFKPRVENTFGFLPDLPIKLLAAGKVIPVNTLHGFNAEEMGMMLDDPRYTTMTVQNFKDSILGTLPTVMPYMLGSLKSFAIPDKDEFVKEALKVYKIDNSSNPVLIRDQAIQATSNLGFVGPIMNEIGLLDSRMNVSSQSQTGRPAHYLYRFMYRPSFSFHSPWYHNIHGDEISFVFGVDLFRRTSDRGLAISDEDHKVSEQMMTAWTNFAKTGNPNLPDTVGDWRPYTVSSDSIMNIDSNSTMGTYAMPEVTSLSLKLIRMIDTAVDLGSWVVG